MTSFAERMGVLERRVGSKAELARRAGLSPSGLHQYFSGGEPTLSKLIALAQAANVSLRWLATGEGPMNEAAEAGPAIDQELLASSILIAQRTAASAAEAGGPVEPRQTAAFAATLYTAARRMVAEGKPLDLITAELRARGDRPAQPRASS